MFSLIITIVSIALVVALIGATMYYGGDTLTEGRARSDAAGIISGAQQIAAGLQLHNAMEGAPYDGDLTDLSAQYLKALPKTQAEGAWTVDTESNTITLGGVPGIVCEAINKSVGSEDGTVVEGAAYSCDGDGDFEMKY